MNTEGFGKAIASIKTNRKQKPPIIYVDDKREANKNFDEFKIKGGEDKLILIPDKETERSIHYITGMSGSGKSTWIKNYADEYRKAYPKNPIYLISALTEDSSIDKIKGLKRLKLKGEEFLTTDLTAEDFQDTLLIFDDCDCITEKGIKNKVYSLLQSVLQTGRHFKVSVCYSSHLATNRAETRIILAESHSITLFPCGMGGNSLKYVLQGYFGLDKNQIKKIKSLDSRWVSILRTYPMIVCCENEIYVLKNDD